MTNLVKAVLESDILKKGKAFAVKHAPKILTGMAMSGSIVAALWAVHATPAWLEREQELQQEYDDLYSMGQAEDNTVPKKVILKEKLKIYWPSIAMEAMSLGCMFSSTFISEKRNAFYAAIYAASEDKLKEYQEKVVEKFGERKEKSVRSDIDQDHLNNHPIKDENDIIQTGKGNELFFDDYSGQYFYSDRNFIDKTVINLNHDIQTNLGMITLNEFYAELGLEMTRFGNRIGWEFDRLIDLDWTTKFAPNGKPCTVMHIIAEPRGYER